MTNNDVVKVAAVQLRVSGDWEKDRIRAAERISFAADKGASLVVFGELFGWTWFAGKMDKDAFGLAETADGDRMATWQKTAKGSKVAVGAPIFLHDGHGTYYNAVAAVDEGGHTAGVYRAVHLPQILGWEGKFYFAGGGEYPVFNLGGLPVGFLICWDAFFPEAFRALALAGARLIVVVTSATGVGEDLWMRALTAQALFNGVYVLRVNRVGEEEQGTFCGHSFCAAPTGDLLGDPMGDVEGVAFFDIDRMAVEITRREFPFLKDRRPQTYLDIANLTIGPKDE